MSLVYGFLYTLSVVMSLVYGFLYTLSAVKKDVKYEFEGSSIFSRLFKGYYERR